MIGVVIMLDPKLSAQLNFDTKEQKRKMESLLSSFDKNVIASSTNTKGKIIYASEAFCKISGYTLDELLGQNHNIVRHPDMKKEFYKNLWNTIKLGNIWKGEIKNKRKDGSFYWVDVVITPEYDINDKLLGYSAVRQDITSQKEVEELSKSLEEKVNERTKDLKKTNKKLSTTLKNLTDAKKDLLAAEKMAALGHLVSGISHELNTPIGVCITSISVLQLNSDRFFTLQSEKKLTREKFEQFKQSSLDSISLIDRNLHRTAELVQSFKLVSVDQSGDDIKNNNGFFSILYYISFVISDDGKDIGIVIIPNLDFICYCRICGCHSHFHHL